MKAIAIYSIKGGVGKSAAAVNLAHIAATSGGRRTLLWDLDAQAAATWLLDSAARRGTKARAAMAGDGDVRELVQPTAYANLDLLAADRSLRRLEGDLAQTDRQKLLRRRLKALAPDYDRILIDCPPGLSELADQIFRAVDLLVVPMLPSPLSANAAAMLDAALRKDHGGGPPVLPYWSMVDRRRKLHRETVATAPDRPVIPYAAMIESMAVRRAPIAAIAPLGPGARAYSSLWQAIEQALLRPERGTGLKTGGKGAA